MNFFKTLFIKGTGNFAEINAEFLEKKKLSYPPDDSYLQWLKSTGAKLEMRKIEAQEKGEIVPAEWHDKIKLIEEAIEKEKKSYYQKR